MKVDGITLLQMIKNKEIKDNTKIIDNTGKRYIYYDSTGNLNEITQLIGDDEETERMYQFTPYQLINYTFEIIEEIEKPKNIEELSFKYTNTYGNASQHKASEKDIINKINEISKAVNYLLKQDK